MGILALLLSPILVVYLPVLYYYLIRRGRDAHRMLRRLAPTDSAWDVSAMKQRVEQAYFAIQYARRDLDTEGPREFMSERLYQKHKTQILDMKLRRYRNTMDAITLKSVKILEVQDARDNAQDRFVALIDGSMIDNLINRDGKVIDGDNEPRSFQELWKFRREPHGWVLDEIVSSFGITELAALESSTDDPFLGRI